MNKPVDPQKIEPIKYRSPAVTKLLDRARETLASLEAELGAATLAEINEEPGAAKAAQVLDARISSAKAEIVKLEAALALAQRNDRVADAEAVAILRAEQLHIFERAGAERVKAMTEILQLLPKATKAFERYVTANQAMVTAVPTGTRLPQMAFDDGNGGNWLGSGELLIAREAFRVAELAGTPRLFFAKPPPLASGLTAATMRPSVDILEEAQGAVQRELTGQVANLNRESLIGAGVAVPPLPIVEIQPPPSPKLFKPRAIEAADAAVRAEPANMPDPFLMPDAEALVGITSIDCASACSEAGCCLTGGPRCAHPLKGGLTRADKIDPKILVRYGAACKAIGVKNINEAEE